MRLVTQCLAKRVEDRPPSASVVAAELRRHAQSLTEVKRPVGLRARVAKSGPLWFVLAIAAVVVAATVAIQRWRTDDGPPERVLRPFVTWPSDEGDSRGSPDGRWVSFVSNRDGTAAMFVQALDAVDARRVALPSGRVVSHLWSPNGREYACAMQLPDGLFLQVFPAPLGGAAMKSFRIDARASGVRLLRWIGTSVYVETRDEKTGRPILGRIDLDAERMTPMSSGWTLPAPLKSDAAYTYFDVSPDGRRVVFSLTSEAQEDLWLANIDGSQVSRLTNDAPFERRPIWTGGGDTVIYQSNRGGQLDLWELPIAGGRPSQLTSDRAAELPESAGGDGGLITFLLSTETAHLWLVDPQAGPIPLTNDALSDLAPSVSRDGRTIVFQRTNSSSLAGNTLLDSRLMKGVLAGQALRLDPDFAAEGFAPQISPDAAEVAYLQGSPPALVLKNLATSQAAVVSKDAAPPGFSSFPNSWTGQNVAWLPTGDLVFVERSPPVKIRRYTARTGLDPLPIVEAERGWRVRDLFPSADGRSLAYLKSSAAAHELHVVDLQSRADRLLTRLEGPQAVLSQGWSALDRSIFLIRQVAVPQAEADPVSVSGAQILEVDLTGAVRDLATVDNALHTTVRIDARRSTAYLTRVVDQIHNLYALALDTRALQAITNNRFPSLSYTGVQPLAGGAAVYFSTERRRDLYVYVPRTAAGR